MPLHYKSVRHTFVYGLIREDRLRFPKSTRLVQFRKRHLASDHVGRVISDNVRRERGANAGPSDYRTILDHDAGPWVAAPSDSDRATIQTPRGRDIANVETRTPQGRANAQLIIAAP